MEWFSIASVIGLAVSEILGVLPKGPNGIIHSVGVALKKLFS